MGLGTMSMDKEQELYINKHKHNVKTTRHSTYTVACKVSTVVGECLDTNCMLEAFNAVYIYINIFISY